MYLNLCIRRFLAQGIISPIEVNLHEVRKIIASVNWMNKVTNIRAFSPKIVRECLVNLFRSVDGVMIRGDRFEISSILINLLVWNSEF